MNEIKNIIVVSDYAYVEGGAVNVAIQTALLLCKYHSDMNVFFFAGSGEPCDELKNSGVKVISLGMPDILNNPNRLNAIVNGIWNKKAEDKFYELLSTLNVDETVVHIHTWTKVLSSSVFKVANKMKVKTFLTLHDYFTVCPNGGCYNYRQQHICTLKPLSMGCFFCNCDSRSYPQKIWRCIRQIKQNSVIHKFRNLRYIFISEFSKNKILDRTTIDENLCYTVRNPIKFGQRHRVNVENNDIFLYIGRLSPEKGVDVFCKAVEKAKVKGVVIGDGRLLNDLKNTYKSITFTGWLEKDEINKYMEKTRALVFPSLWYEGSPLTPLEMQAYGIPCIVSDCCAAQEFISNGVDGMLFSSDDVDSLVCKIKDMSSDIAKKYSENTYNKFDEKLYLDSRYVSDLMKIYKD